MNMPEPKLIAALRGKSIVPEIKLAKAIEFSERQARALHNKFKRLVEESNND